MKIGIFGGTFAPAHNGHVNMAKCAINQLQLDKLIVMPNGLPPHKECVLDKNDRLAITELAFGDIPNVEISHYEIEKDGANYSYETLEHLRSLYPFDELYFVIGGDSLKDFCLWKNPRQIASVATLVVADRGVKISSEYLQKIKNDYFAKIIFLDFQPIPISSSKIRFRYRFGDDNSEYLPKAVDEYIKKKGLFKDSLKKVKTLKTLLEEKRFLHTKSVVEAGLDFARANGISEEKAFLACLLHDCGKNIPVEKWVDYGFSNQEELLPPILHSGLGVLVAQIDFGINDNEILDAIRFHTTAKPQMSSLAMLVFVADKAEKTRRYDTAEYYSLALTNLEKAFKKVLYDMYIIALNKYGAKNVDKTTLSALKYYKLI